MLRMFHEIVWPSLQTQLERQMQKNPYAANEHPLAPDFNVGGCFFSFCFFLLATFFRATNIEIRGRGEGVKGCLPSLCKPHLHTMAVNVQKRREICKVLLKYSGQQYTQTRAASLLRKRVVLVAP